MTSFDIPQAQTINEIVYNRRMKPERRDFAFSTGFGAYHVGDIVLFFFGSITRSGRITNARRKGLSVVYCIECKSHTWYRDIPQEDIISAER